MTDTPSITAVRLSAALVARAKAEGAAQNRSISGQVEHWARLGMALEAAPEARMALLNELLVEGRSMLAAETDRPAPTRARRGFAAADRTSATIRSRKPAMGPKPPR